MFSYDFKKNKHFRNLCTSLSVFLSAFLQAYVIQVFIKSCGLLSSGFSGLAILIERVGELFNFNIPTSISLILLNIPVAILCWKGISKRFTIFSLVQVFFVSLFLDIFKFEPIFDDLILNVIFGGFLGGIGTVISLKFGASTGGTDFIALYISNKKGISIWKYVFMGNVVLLCVFGVLFGWDYAGYSIIYQFVFTKTISNFHQRYERVTLQITTLKADEVIEAYVKNYKHGISCIEAIGGYSKCKMHLLHTVVSSYEVNEIICLMQEIDPYIIINLFKTDQFVGKFYQAPIE